MRTGTWLRHVFWPINNHKFASFSFEQVARRTCSLPNSKKAPSLRSPLWAFLLLLLLLRLRLNSKIPSLEFHFYFKIVVVVGDLSRSLLSIPSASFFPLFSSLLSFVLCFFHFRSPQCWETSRCRGGKGIKLPNLHKYNHKTFTAAAASFAGKKNSHSHSWSRSRSFAFSLVFT